MDLIYPAHETLASLSLVKSALTPALQDTLDTTPELNMLTSQPSNKMAKKKTNTNTKTKKKTNTETNTKTKTRALRTKLRN